MRADPAGELGACDEEPSCELSRCWASKETSDCVSSDCEARAWGSDGRLAARSAAWIAGDCPPLPGRLPSWKDEPRRIICRRCCRSRSLRMCMRFESRAGVGCLAAGNNDRRKLMWWRGCATDDLARRSTSQKSDEAPCHHDTTHSHAPAVGFLLLALRPLRPLLLAALLRQPFALCALRRRRLALGRLRRCGGLSLCVRSRGICCQKRLQLCGTYSNGVRTTMSCRPCAARVSEIIRTANQLRARFTLQRYPTKGPICSSRIRDSCRDGLSMPEACDGMTEMPPRGALL